MKILFKIQNFYLIAFLFSILSCSTKSENSLSQKIVLQIDSVIITEYEYNKNLNFFLEEYKGLHKTDCPVDTINSWNKQFIDRTYMLADAYKKNYKNLPEVVNQVNYMSTAMLTQVHGYLWNAVEVPKIDTSKSLVLDMHKKRQTKFEYVYIKFDPYSERINLMPNDSSDYRKIFFQTLNTINVIPDVKYDTIPVDYYPFLICNFGINPDILLTMRKDEVSKPIETSQGIFLLWLKSKTETVLNENYDDMKFILLHKQEQKFMEDNVVDNNANLKIKYNHDKIIEAYQSLQKCEFWQSMDTLKAKSVQNNLLMTYYLDNRIRKIYVKNFITHYINQPISVIMQTPSQFRDQLKEIAHMEYLVAQAEKLGVTKQTEYLLDKRNFQNDIILNAYFKNELKTQITPDKMLVYMERIKSKYELITNVLNR